MKRLAIIGGIGIMTMAGTNMIWHKQKLGNNSNQDQKHENLPTTVREMECLP